MEAYQQKQRMLDSSPAVNPYNRQIDRQIDRQVDRKKRMVAYQQKQRMLDSSPAVNPYNRQIDRQRDGQIDSLIIDRQTERREWKLINKNKECYILHLQSILTTGRQRERQIDKQIGRSIDRLMYSQID